MSPRSLPMSIPIDHDITSVIGKIPYRMALAGGWIDQPFVSTHNPAPPGSMVVVGLDPAFRFMDRSGMATSTREVARKLWKDALPGQDPRELVRILYDAENQGRAAPSGSQDMAGLIIPVVITVYVDRTFTFVTKTPPAAVLLKKAANLAKGSGTPNKDKVGKVTEAQVREIATQKMPDLNAASVEAAIKSIKGTARSMGIEVVA